MGTAQVLRPLGLTFSFIGAVQGILWTIFSILGILVYAEVIFDFKDPSSVKISVTVAQIILYIRYKNGFSTFLIAYILLSVYWMCLSMYQFWLFQKKKFTGLTIVLIQWATLTSVISLVDLILTIITATDLKDLENMTNVIEEFSSYSGLVVITAVAARGIVLLIINVGSVIASVIFILHLKRKEISLSRYNDHVKPIEAFDHLEPRPSSWYAEVVHDDEPIPRISHVNPAFIDDEIFDADDNYNNNDSYPDNNDPSTDYDYNNHDDVYNSQYNYDGNTIERYIDDEFRYIEQPNYQNHYHPDDEWNQSFDTVSKSSLVSRSKKKEPLKILDMELYPAEGLVPPPIPPPDYTPPSSPVVRARTVLKSNPIYN